MKVFYPLVNVSGVMLPAPAVTKNDLAEPSVEWTGLDGVEVDVDGTESNEEVSTVGSLSFF